MVPALSTSKLVDAAKWDELKRRIESDKKYAREKDKYGMLPLHWASTERHVPIGILHAMLEAYPEGATIKNNAQLLPLHIAVRAKASLDWLKGLLSASPESVLEKIPNGKTAIQLATEVGINAESLRLLQQAEENYKSSHPEAAIEADGSTNSRRVSKNRVLALPDTSRHGHSRKRTNTHQKGLGTATTTNDSVTGTSTSSEGDYSVFQKDPRSRARSYEKANSQSAYRHGTSQGSCSGDSISFQKLEEDNPHASARYENLDRNVDTHRRVKRIVRSALSTREVSKPAGSEGASSLSSKTKTMTPEKVVYPASQQLSEDEDESPMLSREVLRQFQRGRQYSAMDRNSIRRYLDPEEDESRDGVELVKPISDLVKKRNEGGLRATAGPLTPKSNSLRDHFDEDPESLHHGFGGMIHEDLMEITECPTADSPRHRNNEVKNSGSNVSKTISSGAGELIARGAISSDSSSQKSVTRPMWRLSRECNICSSKFSLFRKRHHCRQCGRSICNEHCAGKLPLDHLGFYNPVRVCTACLQYMNTRGGRKALKESGVWSPSSNPNSAVMPVTASAGTSPGDSPAAFRELQRARTEVFELQSTVNTLMLRMREKDTEIVGQREEQARSKMLLRDLMAKVSDLELKISQSSSGTTHGLSRSNPLTSPLMVGRNSDPREAQSQDEHMIL